MTHPLDSFSVPPPAPELRARVLAAAAATALEPRPHWVDRLYEDVALRRALLAAILGLAALLALDLAPRAPRMESRPILWNEEAPPAEDPGMTAAEQLRALGSQG
jgi:hypothetical protein